MRTLTRRASICCRIRFQSFTLDRLATTDADAVRPQRDAFQRALDRTDFLHIAGDLRQVDVDQQVGKGLILEIADAAGDIGIAFGVRPREHLAYLVPQFAPSVSQLVLEARVFVAPARALDASGVVCLRCHAGDSATAMPVAAGIRTGGHGSTRTGAGVFTCYHGGMSRAATGVLILTVLLAACTGRDSSYTLKSISGLVPSLEFQLTDQDGRSVTAADYRHDIVLLYFGYTQCPDECPTTLTTLANALHTLGPRASQVRVLFVSVDPGRDTTAVLKRYVSHFGPEFVGLRGEPAELAALSKRYRIAYHYEKPDSYGNYEVDHSSAIFVFDRRGRARLLGQSDNTAQQVASDLRRLLAST
jgi:protein SCO1